MAQNHSGPDDSAQDRREEEPAVNDRRRIDPETGRARDDRIELPGGGVIDRGPQPESGEPPVDFGDLVRPFLVMGMAGLGVLPLPDSGEPEVDLQAARHAIRVLDLIREKTEGQRSEAETHLLEKALLELKMQFAARTRTTSGE